MLSWLSANLWTVLILLLLLFIVGAAVFSLIRDKRNGKSSCGGNCSHCGACSGCAAPKQKAEQKPLKR